VSRPLVNCPTCGRELTWSSASPFRPFCSERCRLIDLGAWLSEERSIAGEPVPSETESEENAQPTSSRERE
jgi:uncharacterized protein